MSCSLTTAIGVSKILVVYICLGLYYAGKLPLAELVPLVIALQGTLSGIGFIRAKDGAEEEKRGWWR